MFGATLVINKAPTSLYAVPTNPIDPRLCRQVWHNGTNWIGIQDEDALVYPLGTNVTGAPSPVLTNVWNGSFTFQPSFFGTMAFDPNTYPTGLSQGVWRTHDSFTRWSDIETAKGVYSATNLAYLDYIVNTAFNLGQEVMYIVYKTPAWAAVSGNTSAPPVNPSDLTDFLNFLYARYGTKIKYYEGWNEPNVSGSFVGSMANLITHQQTIYNAVKANNATLQVVTPAFGMQAGISTDTLNFTAYLAAGGANYGDAIGYHPYGQDAVLTEDAVLNGTRLNFSRSVIVNAKAAMVSASVSKPLFDTESGTSTPSLNRLIEKHVFAAVGGATMSLTYSWDAVGYPDMRLANLGVAAWNTAVNFLRGKTMTAVNSFGNGDFGVILDGVGYLVTAG